jgi:hypothetical protein
MPILMLNILIYKARVPVGRIILELPAGMLEDDKGDIIGTAVREVHYFNFLAVLKVHFLFASLIAFIVAWQTYLFVFRIEITTFTILFM